MNRETEQTPPPGLEQLSWSSGLIMLVEGLLLLLMLLSLAFQGVSDDERSAISAGLLFYAALVVAAYWRRTRPRFPGGLLAFESWAMIPFITWAIWFTDKLASPLRSAYILILITSALTLGMRATLYQTGLIAVCLVLLGETYAVAEMLSLGYLSGMVAMMTPLIVVAYLTSLFAPEIRYGIRKSKLSRLLDELTGLHGMRGVSVVADRLLAHAARGERPVSLMFVDIDNLGRVNESHGRPAGDRLIREVARIVQDGLRYNDALGRYREDEFVAVLPETPIESALQVAERIRAAVASSSIVFEGRNLPASVSIGLASDAIGAPRFDTMLACAMRAVRTAKENGRNSVVKFPA